MPHSDDIIFLNRERELGFLLKSLPPKSQESSLVIIRAPSGFGKSTLTNQLLHRQLVPNFAVIDPDIRQKTGGLRVYDGFFIQRCAQDLSAHSKGHSYIGFRRFLSYRKWKTAKEKSHVDFVRKYPSFSNLYEHTISYVDRIFGKRDFSVEKLLSSDTQNAVTICREYVEFVCRDDPVLLIIREAQHIDHESLRFFLQKNRELPHQFLIMEYTSSTGHFDSDHQKILLREISDHPNAHLLDLARLEPRHLETLLRTYAKDDLTLTSDYYLKWDGNLRSVIEIKLQTGIARQIRNSADIQHSLADLQGQLKRHLDALTRCEQLILAIVFAHIEAIAKHTLIVIISGIDQFSTAIEIDASLIALIDIHHFLELNQDALRLQNEDIASAIEQTSSLAGLVSLANNELRNYYLGIVDDNNYAVAAMPLAVRQSLRLCAKTGDTTALLRIVVGLSDIVRKVNDQTVYVDAIAEAVSGKQNLFRSEQETLVDWAAELAYDIGDYKRAATLLRGLSNPNLYQSALLACCTQELGEHEFALAILNKHRSSSKEITTQLLFDLIEMTTARDMGDEKRAKNILESIFENARYKDSPAYGYALRFSEMLMDFTQCIPFVIESAHWFRRYKLTNSEAYSRLSGAMLLARAGRTGDALEFIERATDLLKGAIRDPYLILNNRAAVTMLLAKPDFEQCVAWLTTGIRLCRNDFSDVVLLNNLAIAKSQLGAISEAIDCIERMLTILKDPTFGDRDIFWGASFNAMQIFKHGGQIERAEEMKLLPKSMIRTQVYPSYWEYRFGFRSDIDDKYDYLLNFQYHPLYLSHWLIDLEGLKLLKQES